MIKTRYPNIYIDGEDIFKLINGSYILKINRKTLTSILKGTKKTNNYDYEFEYL